MHVTNDGDLDSTVHWHGLRLENACDGVPHETQTPLPIGGSFTYRIQFSDLGTRLEQSGGQKPRLPRLSRR